MEDDRRAHLVVGIERVAQATRRAEIVAQGHGEHGRSQRYGHTATPYVPLTLVDGWVDYGAGYASGSYIKDVTGRVSLHGLVRNGGATIAVLPAGYRPAGRTIFGIVSNQAFGRIDILVDGISFYGEQ